MSRKNNQNSSARERITDAELRRDSLKVIAALREHCRSYELGTTSMASSIALTLRNLLHKGRGEPVLGLLKRLSMPFLSTSFDPVLQTPNFCPLYLPSGSAQIVEGVTVRNRVDPIPRYWSRPGYGPIDLFVEEYEIEWCLKTFEDWWKEPILFAAAGESFSRRDIVLYLANQESGGHVDLDRDVRHLTLSREEAIAIAIGDWRVTPDEGPHGAITRQISYELQLTLDRYCSDLLDEPATVPPHIARMESQKFGIRPEYDFGYQREVLADLEKHGYGNKNTAEEMRSRIYWHELASSRR